MSSGSATIAITSPSRTNQHNALISPSHLRTATRSSPTWELSLIRFRSAGARGPISSTLAGSCSDTVVIGRRGVAPTAGQLLSQSQASASATNVLISLA